MLAAAGIAADALWQYLGRHRQDSVRQVALASRTPGADITAGPWSPENRHRGGDPTPIPVARRNVRQSFHFEPIVARMRGMIDRTTLTQLEDGGFAFIDAGSGEGDSTRRCERRFGSGPGLGIERSSERVDLARASGLAAICADAVEVELPAGCVSFVAMCDFLEHLPSERDVRRALERYCRVARDFLFIQHPSFERIDKLARLGLKIVWSDWDDHTTMMTIADYRRMFASLGLHDVTFHPINPIFDSQHHTIVPVETRGYAEAYDPERHAPKPFVEFDFPLFARYDIFVRLGSALDDDSWRRITAPVDAVLVEGGDGVATFERETARWRIRSTVLEDAGLSTFEFGSPGTSLVPLFGDWDGDGEASPGFYDAATGLFYLSNSRRSGDANIVFEFGASEGVPVTGDWDGDGADGVGVYLPREGQFWLKNGLAEGEADHGFGFGPVDPSFVPIAGDWDGDGVDTVGVYDPATTSFFLSGAHAPGNAQLIRRFGPAGAVPLAGDWNGAGRDGLGVFLASDAGWRLRSDLEQGLDDARFSFGPAGAVPLRVRSNQRPNRRSRSS